MAASEVHLHDPQTLYRRWEEQQWSPFAVELGPDAEQWEAMEPADRGLVLWALEERLVDGDVAVDAVDHQRIGQIRVGRAAGRVVAHDLVERRSDPDDRRAKRLFLTSAARPLLEQLASLGENTMASALECVAPEDVDRMVSHL